jgi:hypothetical protein
MQRFAGAVLEQHQAHSSLLMLLLAEADEVEQGVRHRAWFARCGCGKYERLLTQGFALWV